MKYQTITRKISKDIRKLKQMQPSPFNPADRIEGMIFALERTRRFIYRLKEFEGEK